MPIKVILMPSQKLVIELLAETNEQVLMTPGGVSDPHPLRRLG